VQPPARPAPLSTPLAANTPGVLSDFEIAGGAKSYLDAAQDVCYPIPLSESQTNPNLSKG